jgi:hypothetical protein
MPRQIARTLILTMALVVILSACFPTGGRRLRQDEILDLTWEDLRPNTSSQNRRNWEYVDAARVFGREVVNQFSGLLVSNCPGPTPPENSAIRSSSEYWFVRVVPSRMLPPSNKSSHPPTPPVAIEPEPLFREAQYLIDPFTGEIIARKFVCDVE